MAEVRLLAHRLHGGRGELALTTLDTVLLLALNRAGVRGFEALVVALMGLIGAGFAVELWLSRPDLALLCGLAKA